MHFKQHENRNDLLSFFFGHISLDGLDRMDLAGIMAGEQYGMEVTSFLLA